MTTTEQHAPWVGPGWEQVSIPRDHMDRPLIMNEAGTKRIAYRRCTTFVGALEARYNLEKWKMRRVSWGLGQRPDLVLSASSVHIDDKKALDKVAKDAMEAAESAAKATVGTALHKLCERRDRGQNLGRIPAPHDQDIKAYDAEMKRLGVEHVAIETFRIHDLWKVAGTADRIVKINGRYYIADIKTGDIDRIHKIAMQLAMYRRSQPYDIATDTRTEDPYPIEGDRGLVIHLPAGEAQCMLHWVDLQQGWRGCQVCYTVFDFRSTGRTKLTWPVREQLEFPVNTGQIALYQQIELCETLEELRNLYYGTVNSHLDTPDFTARVRARKAALGG